MDTHEFWLMHEQYCEDEKRADRPPCIRSSGRRRARGAPHAKTATGAASGPTARASRACRTTRKTAAGTATTRAPAGEATFRAARGRNGADAGAIPT